MGMNASFLFEYLSVRGLSVRGQLKEILCMECKNITEKLLRKELCHIY